MHYAARSTPNEINGNNGLNVWSSGIVVLAGLTILTKLTGIRMSLDIIRTEHIIKGKERNLVKPIFVPNFIERKREET